MTYRKFSIRLPHPSIRTHGPGYQHPPNTPGWVYFHNGQVWFTPFWDEVPEDQATLMEAAGICCPQEVHMSVQDIAASRWNRCVLPPGDIALDGHSHRSADRAAPCEIDPC